MAIHLRELFNLARRVEGDLAHLYEDIANHLQVGSEEARFFAHMAAQEHMHAAWVDEMAGEIVEDRMISELSAGDFTHIFITIEDVHDEVLHRNIDVCAALEIIQHMEQSAAEEFYQLFPRDIPGVPADMVERMVKSCVDHRDSVLRFQAKYACRLRKP